MVSPRIQRRGCCNLAALSCSLHFRGSIPVQTICSSGKHPFKSSMNLLLLLLSSLPTLFASFQAVLHTHSSPRSSRTASLAPPVGFGAPRELIPRDWRALQLAQPLLTFLGTVWSTDAVGKLHSGAAPDREEASAATAPSLLSPSLRDLLQEAASPAGIPGLHSKGQAPPAGRCCSLGKIHLEIPKWDP